MLKRLLGFLFILVVLSDARALAQDYVPGQVIVKFKQNSSVGAFNAKMSGTMSYAGGWSGMGLHQYALQPGASVTATILDLQNNSEIEYVEPNYILRKFDGVEGQTYSKQDIQAFSAISIQAGAFGMTAAAIHATDAWVAAAGTGLPIVAIIDSGMDMTHEVLADALWTNPNEIANNGADDDANGYVDDVHGWNFVANNNNPTDGDGHGTHVSGIVRGTTQNLFAVPIDPPKLKLMPLKFLDDTGAGTTSNAINAIYYAVNNGARILNNSWGGSAYSRALLEAISYSYLHHTLFVAAAGNNAQNIDATPMYPASYTVPNVIAVAATTDSDTLAYFSNYGPGTVQVAGPGVSILSSYKGNTYAYLSGTSMAAPFVAGVAVMVAREQPLMWGYQAKQIIMNSTDRFAGLSTNVTSSGRINVLSSVTSSQASTLSFSQPDYFITPNAADRNLASNMSSGGGCGRVAKIYSDINKMDGGTGMGQGVMILLILAPILLVFVLKRKAVGIEGRKFERYQIDSTVSMKIGDKKFEGRVSTISTGGAGINMPIALEEGSLLTMTIRSPDGKDSVTVEGKIVWSTEAQNYGVSFSHLENGMQATIQRWTAGLLKS